MSSQADASTNILGFEYQKMVALQECFGANDGTKIYLECFGDISEENISIEVKHSVNDNKHLTDKHIDFWKTLSNIVKDYETFQYYNHFILHTTAEIQENSIFYDWNNLSKEEKVDKVLSIESNQTIHSYHTRIINFDKDKLASVLDRFKIYDKQPSAKEYYRDILLNHSAVKNAINHIENRERFICSLLGYISTNLIDSDNYKWEIDIDLFRENFQFYLVPYQIKDLRFPKSTKIPSTSEFDNFKFVADLRKINYARQIARAVRYYVQASESQVQMITSRQKLVDVLNEYDSEIEDIALETQERHLDKVDNGSDITQESKEFFNSSIDRVAQKKQIEGVVAVSDYYPKGRLMHTFEQGNVKIDLGSNYESK